MATGCPVVAFNPLPFSVAVTDRGWHKAVFTKKWHFSCWMRLKKIKLFQQRTTTKAPKCMVCYGFGYLSCANPLFISVEAAGRLYLSIPEVVLYLYKQKKKMKTIVLGVACRQLLLWLSFPCVPNASLKEPGSFLHGICEESAHSVLFSLIIAGVPLLSA